MKEVEKKCWQYKFCSPLLFFLGWVVDQMHAPALMHEEVLGSHTELDCRISATVSDSKGREDDLRGMAAMPQRNLKG